MIVYRICVEEFSTDLPGSGAMRYGGRWNIRGNAVLYTSHRVHWLQLNMLCICALEIAKMNSGWFLSKFLKEVLSGKLVMKTLTITGIVFHFIFLPKELEMIGLRVKNHWF